VIPGFRWVNVAATETATKPIAAKSPRSGPLVILRETFSSPAIFLLPYHYAYIRKGNAKAALSASAAIWPVLRLCFTWRPQLLGYIFLLVTLIWLERYRQGSQTSIWLFPGVFVLWVNTYGTYTLGLLAIVICCVAGLRDLCLMDIESRPWTKRRGKGLELTP